MHHCEGAVITCEDFRLHQRPDGRNFIAEFIKNLGYDCDLITRGGGVQDLVRPQSGFDKAVLRDLGVSAKLHGASKIFLVNHGDCGAYSPFSFKSAQEEFEQHKKDLLAAKEIINKEFPGKEIKTYFARLIAAEKYFEIEEVEQPH